MSEDVLRLPKGPLRSLAVACYYLRSLWFVSFCLTALQFFPRLPEWVAASVAILLLDAVVALLVWRHERREALAQRAVGAEVSAGSGDEVRQG